MKKYFPSLKRYNNFIFCDNAGGSQVPKYVINSTKNFLVNNYVQPYSNNIISKKMTKNLDEIKFVTDKILNNKSGHIIYGSSTTQLMYNFANALDSTTLLSNRQEIVLTDFTHESCITPFERNAIRNNTKINWWSLDDNYEINYDNLLNSINKNTSFVVLPHVSNILGNIIDIKFLNHEIKKINPDTKVFIDGVAYLPHGLIDVDNYDIDLYMVSFYKFCGLRISACYIKNYEFLHSISNQNHYFFDNNENIEKKLEIGGYNYECANSIIGLKKYLLKISNDFNKNSKNSKNSKNRKKSKNSKKNFDRKVIKNVMKNIYNYEKILSDRFKNCIKNNKSIKIIESTQDKVPIFSLLFKDNNLFNITLILNELDIIAKNSTFYCDRLFDSLNEKSGALRLSFMHYNTIYEVDKVGEILNMFKKYNLLFNYKIDKIDKINTIKNKDILKNSFNLLKKDRYYHNTRYRAFSLLDIDDINNLKIIGDLNFYQSENYNNFNGNILRTYNNISSNILSDYSFKSMINIFKINAEKEFKEKIRYILIHQIRVIIDDNNNIVTPEGIHQDGYNIVGICCINKNNIEGGINNIYDKDKKLIYSKLLDEGEMLIINDNNYYHDVSAIKSKDNNGYRDMIILTTIS